MKKFSNLRIITNFACDQRCDFCYQTKWDYNYITVDQIKHAIESQEIPLNKVSEQIQTVTILGGEPTLNPHLLDILKFCKDELKIKDIRLNTNGNKLIEKNNFQDLFILPFLDVLTLNIALCQTRSIDYNLSMTIEKITLAKKILNIFPKMKIKFNHVFYEGNKENINTYFKSTFDLMSTFLPMEKIMINVCEDAKPNNSIDINAFQQLTGCKIKEQLPYLTLLDYQGKDIAYFDSHLYGNTEDFLLVWNEGVATNINDYLIIFLHPLTNT